MGAFRHWWLAVIANVFLLQPALAAESGIAQLVDVQWLESNLKRDDLLLIDASLSKVHATGHIPGAVSVDVFNYGGNMVPAVEMERRIQSWGVSVGKKVVLYDAGASYFATNLLFDLVYHGFPAKDLHVLDGGLAKWQAAGGAVTKEPTPAPKAGTFRITNYVEDVRVRLPAFLVASGDPANYALVEALEPAQHFGGARFFDRAGHIPHAILAPSADFFKADKTFKSPAEIGRMLDYLGIKPSQEIQAHCGGGIAATVPWFAAKYLLGYPNVKVYRESQLEWLRDDRGLPFWTYDAPNLVRDRTWVHGWGGQMIRGFGVSKLSVIDVRPETAFRQSHVPFAINVPAEVFRKHLANPAKLAEALGAAGVDAGFEAVIVSQGGVSPDAALAFLMLEKVGQKRVSVLLESVDDWGLANLPLEKEADAADPRKAAMRSRFVRPMAYPVDLRPGIVIADSGGAQGLYPKVYLASGKALPAKLPEGNVIHLPYADLLDANGTPKPAMDIWNALAKAGVPRYAEVISISDDPGEAAASYFILKLMGFPDIKIQVP